MVYDGNRMEISPLAALGRNDRKRENGRNDRKKESDDFSPDSDKYYM